MLNQLLRLGALIATGRFLKPRLKGLLWIAGIWLVLWFVHSEFVNYVQLTGNTRYVLHATLLKTMLYALSIAVYVWRVERKLWPKPVKMPPAAPSEHKPRPAPAPQLASQATARPAGDDGFDFLRHKKKLKEPASKLLDKP